MINLFKEPFSFFDPTSVAIPFYVIFICIELYYSTKNRLHVYEKKDTKANLSIAFSFLFFSVLGRCIAYVFFKKIYQYHLLEIPNSGWAWIALLFADDFTFYWYHRLHHQVRLFWAAHVVHHSSEKLNLTTPFREPWSVILYYHFFWTWLPLIGFKPSMVLTMISINLIYQFWIHSTFIRKLGFLEWFMNTPSHHRVHHASNIKYLDKNNAGIFIIWDKLFGTFQKEDDKPIYGLTHNIKTYNPVTINFHEYAALWNDVKNTKTISKKLSYLFYPPGWSADGNGKTTKELQKEITQATRIINFPRP